MGKIASEKDTLKKLKEIFGNETVFLTEKNFYGDRRKYAFGFWIKQLANKYNLIDKAPAGYSNQYDESVERLLVSELKSNGFEVHNVNVGSWVHGWIHRVIYMNDQNFQPIKILP